MILLKGHLWHLTIHSYKYWRTVLQDETEPPVIPFVKLGITMPYGIYEKDGEKYLPIGIYLFPFAIRYWKKMR